MHTKAQQWHFQAFVFQYALFLLGRSKTQNKHKQDREAPHPSARL